MSKPTPSRGFGALLERRRVQNHAARPAEIRPSRPVVSFTFDGFPRSAARNGAPLLENVGGRGTFYASAGAQADAMFGAEDLKRLAGAGHEIGCRTFTGLDCARAPVDDIFSDMVRNADALGAMGLEDRLVSFAYPGGQTTVAMKGRLPSRFTSARGTGPGLASGRADLAQLRANAMFGPGALARCLALLELARRRNGWVIFHAHDVSPRPGPQGTPTGLLERLCGAAFAAGVEILPIRDVVGRIGVERSA